MSTMDMFSQEKQAMDYQISYNTFRDEILHKQMLIETFEHQLQIKMSKLNITSQKNTAYFIRFVNRGIDEIQRVFFDLKSFYAELKLSFAYEIFYRMFKFMIGSFKAMSKLLMSYVKARMKQFQATTSKFHNNGLDQVAQFPKKLQYLDFMIRDIEIEEERIIKEKNEAQNSFRQRRLALENTNASDVVHQLKELKINLDSVIEQSSRSFDQNCLYRHQQLKNYIASLKSPEQMNLLFQEQANAMRTLLVTQVKQAMFNLYRQLKNKNKQLIYQQILAQQQSKLQTNQIQTQPIRLAFNNQRISIQQAEVYLSLHQALQRDHDQKSKELNVLKNEINQAANTIKQLEKMNRNTSELYQKKIQQINTQKMDFEYLLGKKEGTIKLLNDRINQYKCKYKEIQRVSQEVQCNQLQFEDLGCGLSKFLIESKKSERDVDGKLSISSKSRIPSKRPEKSITFEREFKILKKQSTIYRHNFLLLIGSLSSRWNMTNCKFDDFDINALNQNTEKWIKEFEDKIQSITAKKTVELLEISKKNIQEKAVQTQCNKWIPGLSSQSDKQVHVQAEIKGVRVEGPSVIGLKSFSNPCTDRLEENRFEQLKKQLLQKATKNRKVSGRFYSRSKQKKVQFSDQQCASRVNYNETLDGIWRGSAKPAKQQTINYKQISFQATGRQQTTQKGIQKSGILKEHRKITTPCIEQQVSNISVINLSNLPNATKILQQVEQKNDKKDQYYTKFVRNFMLEVKKNKGDKFFHSIIANLGNNLVIKQATKINLWPIMSVDRQNYQHSKTLMRKLIR